MKKQRFLFLAAVLLISFIGAVSVCPASAADSDAGERVERTELLRRIGARLAGCGSLSVSQSITSDGSYAGYDRSRLDIVRDPLQISFTSERQSKTTDGAGTDGVTVYFTESSDQKSYYCYTHNLDGDALWKMYILDIERFFAGLSAEAAEFLKSEDLPEILWRIFLDALPGLTDPETADKIRAFFEEPGETVVLTPLEETGLASFCLALPSGSAVFRIKTDDDMLESYLLNLQGIRVEGTLRCDDTEELYMPVPAVMMETVDYTQDAIEWVNDFVKTYPDCLF